MIIKNKNKNQTDHPHTPQLATTSREPDIWIWK